MAFEELYGEARPGVSGGRWKATGKAEPVAVQIDRGIKQGPETSWNFWYPQRFGVQLAPEDFRARLHEVDPRLEATWHPIKERWTVWCRNPLVTFKLCPGWRMIFVVQYPDGAYMPLDERTLAEAWSRNPRVQGPGREYWKRIEGEIRRDYQRAEAKRYDSLEVRARDQWRYAQIKNIGLGSKFANHDAAD